MLASRQADVGRVILVDALRLATYSAAMSLPRAASSRLACPTKAPQPPSGDTWMHEIKHDGFRVIARKDGERVRLYSRPGNDLTYRFPLIVEALARLRSRSCIIDGEAVCCDEDGMPNFDRIRCRRHDASVFLYAFDLVELSGDDLTRAAGNAQGHAGLGPEPRRSHPTIQRPL
jgi:ATP-dependent DNA ligase